MSDQANVFLDRTGASLEKELDFWEPYVVTKEVLDEEIERLAALPAPGNGRRESLIKHPRATAPGNGLAPVTRGVCSVLKPGGTTHP